MSNVCFPYGTNMKCLKLLLIYIVWIPNAVVVLRVATGRIAPDGHILYDVRSKKKSGEPASPSRVISDRNAAVLFSAEALALIVPHLTFSNRIECALICSGSWFLAGALISCLTGHAIAFHLIGSNWLLRRQIERSVREFIDENRHIFSLAVGLTFLDSSLRVILGELHGKI